MSNCNIFPLIVIAIVVIIVLYFISQNQMTSGTDNSKNQPSSEMNKEQFIPYGYGYSYRYGYPYNYYNYYRTRYPGVSWARYGNYYYPYGGYFSPYYPAY